MGGAQVLVDLDAASSVLNIGLLQPDSIDIRTPPNSDQDLVGFNPYVIVEEQTDAVRGLFHPLQGCVGPKIDTVLRLPARLAA